jgi:hypothetical protein
MGWQIDLFRIPPGLDPHLVRDVEYGEVSSDLYATPSTSDETDAWIYRVLALLEEVAPGLKLVDEPDAASFDKAGHVVHARAWQPDGRLLVNIYPGSVDVRIQRGRLHEEYEGQDFYALWDACRVLAQRGECAVFPQYDDDPTDMTMDREEARRELDWA